MVGLLTTLAEEDLGRRPRVELLLGVLEVGCVFSCEASLGMTELISAACVATESSSDTALLTLLLVATGQHLEELLPTARLPKMVGMSDGL